MKLSPRLQNLSVSTSTKRNFVSSLANRMLKNIKKEHLCEKQIEVISKHPEFNKVSKLVSNLSPLKKQRPASTMLPVEWGRDSSPQRRDLSTAFSILSNKKEISAELRKITTLKSKGKFLSFNMTPLKGVARGKTKRIQSQHSSLC